MLTHFRLIVKWPIPPARPACSVTPEEFGWKADNEYQSINGQVLKILPQTNLVGDPPYNHITIILSGLDGSLRYRYAYST
jgi:hypothetical protein